MKTETARPDALIDAIVGYRKAKVLMVAAFYHCFDHLECPISSAALADRLGLDRRATEILLDALAASGVIIKSGALYHNTEHSSSFLVRGRPGYLGDNLRYQELISEAWGDLRTVVKTGRAARPLGYWLRDHQGFAREYIHGMANIARGPAREIAGLVKTPKGCRLLDVGAGPGSYALAFLGKDPSLRATLLDLEGTLEITRQIMDSQPPELARRVTLKAGDYTRAFFGRAAYDLVLLSHITHDESPEVTRRLIQKSYSALRPGGRILIHDFMLQDCRTSPRFGALFSVHMLTYTSAGRTYTSSEYESWLKAAGFTLAGRHAIGVESSNATQLIVGLK